MKKIFIMLLAALMLFAFVACDDSNDDVLPEADAYITTAAQLKAFATGEDNDDSELTAYAEAEDAIITASIELSSNLTISRPNVVLSCYGDGAIIVSGFAGIDSETTGMINIGAASVELKDMKMSLKTGTANPATASYFVRILSNGTGSKVTNGEFSGVETVAANTAVHGINVNASGCTVSGNKLSGFRMPIYFDASDVAGTISDNQISNFQKVELESDSTKVSFTGNSFTGRLSSNAYDVKFLVSMDKAACSAVSTANNNAVVVSNTYTGE